MFSALFSSKNKEVSYQRNTAPSSLVSKMKGFASKVSVILGLTASQTTISAPVAPEMPSFKKELATMTDASILRALPNQAILPPKVPVLPEKKITPIEPLSAPSKLRLAVAQKGETMDIFMMRNFGITEGAHLLIEKETGRKPTAKSLIAGKTYVLARSEKEAQSLAEIFKKQSAKKVSQSEKQTIAPEVRISKKQQYPGIRWEGGMASGRDIVENARNFLDMTYGLGGNGINKIDCSGLINQSMKLSGIIGESAPRFVSGDFRSIIQKMEKKSPQHVKEGDLIYTPPRRRGGYGHVMMVSGAFKDGKIPVIQASSSHGAVVESEVKYTANMTIGTPPWVEEAQTYTGVISEGMHTKASSNNGPILSNESHQSTTFNSSSEIKNKPKIMISTISANESRFDGTRKEKQIIASLSKDTDISSKISSIQKKESIAPDTTIELTPIGKVQDMTLTAINKIIDQEVGARYKIEAIKKLQKCKGENCVKIQEVFSHFTQASDFIRYYRENIEYYENVGGGEKILPGLRKLLSEVESQVMVANNDDVFLKKNPSLVLKGASNLYYTKKVSGFIVILFGNLNLRILK